MPDTPGGVRDAPGTVPDVPGDVPDMRDKVPEAVATRVAEGVAAAVACLMETAE